MGASACPYLGMGAGGEPQERTSISILQMAQGPGKHQLTVKEVQGLQFLTLAALRVSFPEGTGKRGHGKKCDIFPKATWRGSDSPRTAWRGGGVLLPKEGTCPC